MMNLLIPRAAAHKIETDKDVGATLHIEPNDTPRAGEATQTWFALTRKGGKVIPLKECNCELAIYSQPRKTAAKSLIQANLQPISAERYQGIPGAEITFPKPGAYQLEFSGKPIKNDSFKPFKLKFDVTVATGIQTDNQQVITNQQEMQNINSLPTEKQGFPSPFWFMGLGALVIIAGIFTLIKKAKS